jgi:hypothetical protein
MTRNAIWRADLARHEGDFRAHAEEQLSVAELLALLGASAEGGEWSRENAVACYLSGSEGWRDAVKLLRGTFAEETAELKDRNAD